MFARKAYYNMEKIAVNNKHRGDVSMIVDAAGGLGAIFLPRYSTFEINEPARHEMCKIESTIIKVHRVIQSSYQYTRVRDARCQFDF
jgi:hypothetical protein